MNSMQNEDPVVLHPPSCIYRFSSMPEGNCLVKAPVRELEGNWLLLSSSFMQFTFLPFPTTSITAITLPSKPQPDPSIEPSQGSILYPYGFGSVRMIDVLMQGWETLLEWPMFSSGG
ncbi:hypothetical protein SUGI_1512490 [Cryptomeria japonica]|uniref:Uncharacterized protein n=1 Tax=Cryptomeria japonica TaxID=3369 RepID=A0AAD3NPF4_CRYJA|nr:hypothetical protein SUGI_1512490 [Cryptomeria japonica]